MRLRSFSSIVGAEHRPEVAKRVASPYPVLVPISRPQTPVPQTPLRKVEDVGASGVAERYHRIDLEPRCTARSLASVSHPSRLRSNAREARSWLVPRERSVKRTIPASAGALGTEGVNNTRTITPPHRYQLWRGRTPDSPASIRLRR